MKVIRDRDARWLPSRFNFALLRLIAYFRSRAKETPVSPGVVLVVDRHQNAFENYAVGTLVLVVASAFVATLLDRVMSFPAACIAALTITLLAMQAWIASTVVVSLVLRAFGREGDVKPLNATILLSAAIAGAALLTTSTSRLRHVGTVFLILVAANALASVVVFMMQRSFDDLERRIGVEG